jgi:CheY-like chemotaxis protein
MEMQNQEGGKAMNPIILLAEDDEVDAMAVYRAAMIAGCQSSILRVRDGVEAVEVLSSHAKPNIRLVITDINMPRMNGLELLEHMKSTPDLQPIPVVVLTTSRDERDVMTAYKNNVAGYMVKPVDHKQFEDVARIVFDYWNLSL